MKAVIIAAGNSSRLWPKTNKTPKTLLPYQNGTILSTIMHNIADAGIDEFVFILGFKPEYIKKYLDENLSKLPYLGVLIKDHQDIEDIKKRRR